MGVDAIGGMSTAAGALPSQPLALLGATLIVSDPYPAGAFDSGTLPAQVTVAVAPASAVRKPTMLVGWTAKAVALDSAIIDLDGYRLFVDDAEASLTLENLSNGYSSRIWGKAGFEAGGEQIGPFAGRISLLLANEMLITCETSRDAQVANAYCLNALIITNRDNALIVRGIGGSATDDLSFAGTTEGGHVDDETADGLVLVEDKVEPGWRTETGDSRAGAAYLAMTAEGEAFGPDSYAWSNREFERVFTTFSRFLTTTAAIDSERSTRETVSDLQRESDAIAARLRAQLRSAEAAIGSRDATASTPSPSFTR